MKPDAPDADLAVEGAAVTESEIRKFAKVTVNHAEEAEIGAQNPDFPNLDGLSGSRCQAAVNAEAWIAGSDSEQTDKTNMPKKHENAPTNAITHRPREGTAVEQRPHQETRARWVATSAPFTAGEREVCGPDEAPPA